MAKNKQVLWGVVIVVIVIIIGLAIYHSTKNSPSSSSGNPSNQTSATPTPEASVSPTPTPIPTLSSGYKVPTNYADAVKEFEGRRIQFDPTCQAKPNTITFRNPATFMLDNRSPKSAKIVIDKVTYNLAAYGYRIVTLNQSGLPKNNLVDCNTSQNVAQILMQK